MSNSSESDLLKMTTRLEMENMNTENYSHCNNRDRGVFGPLQVYRYEDVKRLIISNPSRELSSCFLWLESIYLDGKLEGQ